MLGFCSMLGMLQYMMETYWAEAAAARARKGAMMVVNCILTVWFWF